jgi:prefoldin beta subunit
MADPKEKIGKLQVMEHNLHNLEQQRQQMQAQLFELESAIGSLADAKSAYKIVGSVMVHAQPATLLKELQQKKEVLDVRIQSIEKQEEKLRDSAKALQDEVMSELKK